MGTKQKTSWQCIKDLDGGLIVSCQASSGEPMCSPQHILALALSAIAGGAKGLRLEGIENIQAVKRSSRVPFHIPVCGLVKDNSVSPEARLSKTYITSSYKDAAAIADAGADIVAIDATGRPRSDGSTVADLIDKIHKELHKPVWADVATFAEGMAALEAGADIISTTLFGYTQETYAPLEHGPGLELLKELADHSTVPVILEGRIWDPQDVKQGFEMGAYAVVVGSAITRPILITERFVKAIPARRPRKSSVS